MIRTGNIEYDFDKILDDNLENFTLSFTNKLASSLGGEYEYYASFYDDDFCKIYQKFLDEFKDEKMFSDILKIEIHSIAHTLQPPQSLNVYHIDSFYRLKNEGLNNLVRANIFMKKWHPGHVLHLKDDSWNKWKKGDYIVWDSQEPHLAANLGAINKHTLQISGVDVFQT